MKVNINNKLMLAPLAGYTDQAFRKIALDWGADIVYTEMISARAIRYQDQKTNSMLEVGPEISRGLVGVQLFGSDEVDLSYATDQLNSNKDISLIDLNLGCPAPKIVKNGDGSALMRDPDQVYRLVKSMRENTDRSLSAKIRTGIDNMDNYIDVAQAVEAGGADFLMIHGRSREQQYSGQADWDKITRVAETLSIPVIGNGDIDTPEVAKTRLDSPVAGLMIGRGAIGAPWIFTQIKDYLATGSYEDISIDQRFDTMIEHLELSVGIKKEPTGVFEMRKQLHKYLAGLDGSANIRNQINKLVEMTDVIDCLNEYRASLIDKEI